MIHVVKILKSDKNYNTCILRIPHHHPTPLPPPPHPTPPHEVTAKWTWRYRSRSKTLHATHPLMLMIVCGKYGKNPSRTVDATERKRFSRSRPNDLENIGQGQRSLHATHPLMLMMICAKYGKNPSETVDTTERTRIFKVKTEWPWKYRSRSKVITWNTPSDAN